MRFTHRSLIAFAIFALAAIALWVWLFLSPNALFGSEPGQPVLSQGVDIETPQAEDERRRPSGPMGMVDQTHSFAELPALSEPLSSIIVELRERANSGDPNAACRLAAEFSYCRQLSFMEAEDSRWLTQRVLALEAIDDSAVRNQALAAADRDLESRSTRSDRLRDHCEGVSIPDTQSISDDWRRAALLGNMAAMKQYSSGNSFRWNEILDSLPRLSLYRAEAEDIALSVAQGGDLDMRVALAAGYSSEARGSRNLLAQALKPDQAMSLAIYEQLAYELSVFDEPDERFSRFKAEVESLLEHARQLSSEEDEIRARSIRAGSLSDWVPVDARMVTNRTSIGPNIGDISREHCSDY